LADLQRTVYPHSGHPSSEGRAQDSVSSPAKDRRSANCATQPIYVGSLSTVSMRVNCQSGLANGIPVVRNDIIRSASPPSWLLRRTCLSAIGDRSFSGRYSVRLEWFTAARHVYTTASLSVFQSRLKTSKDRLIV